MMECDVTRELLELSRAGFDTFKELLNFLLIVGKGGYEIMNHQKKEPYLTGLVSPKKFFEQNTPVKSVGNTIPDDFQHNVWNKLCEKYDFAYIIKNDVDVNGDGKIDKNDSYMVVSQEKIQNYELALGEYYQITRSKAFVEEQLPQEMSNMSDKQLEEVRDKREKMTELLQVKNSEGQEVGIPYNLFKEEHRQQILKKIREITRSEIPLSSKKFLKMVAKTDNFNIGEASPKDFAEIINWNQDNRSIRKDIVIQLEKALGEDQVTSFKGDKGIFFIDANDQAVFMNFEKGKICVNPMTQDVKEKAQNIIETINVQKLRKNKELEAAMQETYSQEKIDFIKSMEDECLIIPQNETLGWEEYPKDLVDSYHAVRNYLIYNEVHETELSSKAESLWQIAKSGYFMPEMTRLDEESCWAIADAQRKGISKEHIEDLCNEEYTALDRNILIMALEQEPNLSKEEKMEICEKAKTNIADIQYFCTTNNFKDKEKASMESVRSTIAENKLERMLEEQIGMQQVRQFEVTPNSKIHHIDETGEAWYQAYKDTGQAIFVNKAMDEMKYQIDMHSEEIGSEALQGLKKAYKTQGKNKATYYRKDKNTLINERGKTIFEKSMKLDKAKDMTAQVQQKVGKVKESIGR